MADLDDDLRRLADAYGIATDYWGGQGQHVPVPPETVRAVLAALDVDAATPEAAVRALAAREQEPWTRMLPACRAVRSGRTTSVDVHVRHGDAVEVWIDLETGGGGEHPHQRENGNGPRTLDGPYPGGGPGGGAAFEVPDNHPLGYHTLRARSTDAADEVHEAAMALIITPSWLGFPASVGERRAWGIATQLYSVRSRQSWGVGDLVDLEDLAVWSAT